MTSELGEAVVIIKEHVDYAGTRHMAGEIAHIYAGATYGVWASDETALVFGRKLPFMATPDDKFRELRRKGRNA